MTYIFNADFDGTLNLQVGDTLEIKIVGTDGKDTYDVKIVRQTGVREPPALGINVSDNLDLTDRVA